jgi:hypothetical protein
LRFVTNIFQSRNNRACLSDTQTAITDIVSAAEVMKPRSPWDVIMKDVKLPLILGDCSCLNVESAATFAWEDWKQYQFETWTKHIHNASLDQYNGYIGKKNSENCKQLGVEPWSYVQHVVESMWMYTLVRCPNTCRTVKVVGVFFFNHEFDNCIFAALNIRLPIWSCISHINSLLQKKKAVLNVFFVQCKWN